jgi:hypothetical protein
MAHQATPFDVALYAHSAHLKHARQYTQFRWSWIYCTEPSDIVVDRISMVPAAPRLTRRWGCFWPAASHV